MVFFFHCYSIRPSILKLITTNSLVMFTKVTTVNMERYEARSFSNIRILISIVNKERY